MKISDRKLKKLVTEEKRTAKEYRAYGFKKQAKQEAQHSKSFSQMLKERKKK